MDKTEALNTFEKDLMNSIFDSENRETFPDLWKQLPYLRVRSRQFTGVGCYVNFVLLEEGQRYINSSYGATLISPDAVVVMENLPAHLDFVLAIEGGRLEQLEIVTCEGSWDGTIYKYKMVSKG